MMSKHCVALVCMRGGFRDSVDGRLFFPFVHCIRQKKKTELHVYQNLSSLFGVFFHIDAVQLKAQCASFSDLWWSESVLQEMFVSFF